MTEISIIIPVYNAEKYISKCLEALITQTFKDIEILCIDDGSKDNSLKILNQYASKDERIKVFTQANSGPAAARNKGLEAASGKYLMFCDSDDWYEPDMCEQMRKTIVEQDVDVVQCCSWVEREYDSLSRRNFEDYLNNSKTGLYLFKKNTIFLPNVLLWNKIWKKSIVDKYNIKFPSGCEHDDDAFCLMYFLVSETIFFISQHLYHYIIRENSIMENYNNKKMKNKWDRIKISEFIGDYLIRNKLLEERKDFLFNIFKWQIKNLQKIFFLQEVIPMVKRLELYCRKNIDKHIKFLSSPTGKILIINEKDISLLHYEKYKLLSKMTFGEMRKHYKRKRKELKSKIKQVKQFLKGK